MSSGQAGKGSGTRRNPRAVGTAVERAVLLEAGYSCANPTCRVPLIHIHHIDYVENGGANTEGNLIALCPNCHARVHQSQIPEEAVRTWKTMLVAANHAWSKETLNALLFLDGPQASSLYFTGDGIVRFIDLLVSGLAVANEAHDFTSYSPYLSVPALTGPSLVALVKDLAAKVYQVRLTDKGGRLVAAWKNGELEKLSLALNEPRAQQQ